MFRTLRTLWPLLLVAVFVAPRAASADQPDLRKFVGGLGGMTFQTVTNSNIAGNAGMSLSRHVQVFGELGWTMSVLPKAEHTAITDNAFVETSNLGENVTTSGGLSALEGFGGVRLIGSSARRISPFAEAAVGFARLTDRISATASDGSIVTPLVVTPALTQTLPETDPLVVVGGGIDVAPGGRTSVDLGYRFSEIRTSNAAPAINTGNVYGAVRVRF